MFRKMLAVMLVAGIAGLGTMLALPPSVAAQGSPSATRSFSPASVAPGGQVTVTITAANYGIAGGLTETLPPGFSYVSSSLPEEQVNATGQEVRFTLPRGYLLYLHCYRFQCGRFLWLLRNPEGL